MMRLDAAACREVGAAEAEGRRMLSAQRIHSTPSGSVGLHVPRQAHAESGGLGRVGRVGQGCAQIGFFIVETRKETGCGLGERGCGCEVGWLCVCVCVSVTP